MTQKHRPGRHEAGAAVQRAGYEGIGSAGGTAHRSHPRDLMGEFVWDPLPQSPVRTVLIVFFRQASILSFVSASVPN